MSKFIVSIFLLAALGGCGQKGPLYEEKAPEANKETISETEKKTESQ